MDIRPATPSDLPAMLEIERACQTAAHWSHQEYAHMFQAGATPRVALVADDSGVIAGFLVARALAHEWELENVAVLPARRGHGIGTELMSAFVTQARYRHAETILLEVRESNAAARALYARSGFVESGRRSLYYNHPAEDAILYRLPLRSGLSSAP